ncbi:DUF7257 domain-containing protein [Mycolicibacterium komossense]|uniref:Minor tail protein n=1 Tax=Mycolicibacterium komossense TaxID=1779 RepID=A0ABT3C9Z2_9MYCO|nr:hypothetical protein [Mycolicibacterium komossense]MCV7226051.1 hypothetical protein [Mycolicibacterium komossense]
MGGKVYDRRPLEVDRDPRKQLAEEVGRFPKLTPESLLAGYVKSLQDFGMEALRQVIGIDLPLFFAWLKGLIPNFDFTSFPTPEQAWTSIIHAFLDPLSGIGDAITKAFSGITLVDPGTAANNVWNAITGILTVGNNAQNVGNNAMREINALKARFFAGDGAYYIDNLDYASSPYLPSPYVRYESGPGAGTFGPNGSSALAWKAAGASARTCCYRNPDMHISTGKFGAAMLLETVSERSGPMNYLGAVNSSGNGIALGRSFNQAGLVTVSAGVPSALISPLSYTEDKGDSWEIYYGTTADPRSARIILNGGAAVVVADTGITLDNDIYLYLGGSAVNFFFTQAVPARVGSFTFFESNL